MIKKLLIACCILCFSTAIFAIEKPEELVRRTAEDVLAIVKSDKDIQAGNLDKLNSLAEEKILPNFNFDRVSRLVLGKNWTRATPEQKSAFQAEFKILLIRTYSVALSKYKNETIEYKPLRMAEAATNVTVKTAILQSGGQPVLVDYSLEKQSDAWKVYDIVIEGVSLVTNYRSQFAQEIRQNGLDGLIKKLAEKNSSSKRKVN